MCERGGSGYPKIRTGFPQSVPPLQARRRARFAGSFVYSGACKSRPNKLAPLGSSPAVAVGADDFALLYFGEDCVPRHVRQLRSDRERFVAKMVELEDDRVRFAAVRARMKVEVFEQQLRALQRKSA